MKVSQTNNTGIKQVNRLMIISWIAARLGLAPQHFERQLTVYPEAGHDASTETYANPELYKWFLEHTRKHGS